MPRDWTDTYSFTRGVAAQADSGYLVLCNDELSNEKTPHGLCVQWNAGRWKQVGVVNHLITSICTFGAAPKSMAALGEFGNALLFNGAARRDEDIRSGDQSPQRRGPLRCIREIGGNLYVAGMNRQVYQRLDDNRWLIIDAGARPSDLREVVGFESIDGFTARELYAAGWKGEIWTYDGNAWRQIDSPTNVILTDVCCANDESVYICGRLGLLIRGRYDTWAPIEHGSGEDFWGMAWYANRLYLATTRSVYMLIDDRLERVDFGADLPATCYQLSASEGMLWSIGAKDVMAFDGNQWTRID